ncbi:MAG: TIM-barrel domain-containing protein [Flavobacteriaceae bacterium]
MKIFRLTILFLLVGQFSFAQQMGVEIPTEKGVFTFQGIGENGLELSFIQPGQEVEASHARIEDYEPVQVVRTGKLVTVKNGDMKAVFDLNTNEIKYSFKGELLVVDQNRFYSDKGLKLEMEISEDEALYGTGERVLGMNRRGNELYLYNRAHYGYETHSELMNFTMPLVYSSKRYAVHFDNPSVGHINLDAQKDNSLDYDAEYGVIRYQVIADESWAGLMNQYTDFSGKQPMIPRWALGNFSSRFGYHTQDEVINTIKKFKEEDIPVDAIILDLYWFGKDVQGHMGNLAFDLDSFPDPKKMVDDLQEMDVQTVLITEPFVLTTSDRWEETSSRGLLGVKQDGSPYTYDFFFGNTGLIDVYNPETVDWFWGIYKELKEMGVTGFWGDLGEPEVHPKGMLHYGGKHANEVHNTFGSDWAKIIHDGYKENYPNQRPFILMRAGYSGAQRYGMIPWSGDVNRTWGGLVPQTEIALQMGMQGMGYMHSDLGGFAGANLDDELYERWLQYGVFQPIYRPHAQEEVPSEPVFRSEEAKDIAREAIKLRYALMPYNYSLVYENNTTGMPLMRPLFFEEAGNTTYQNLSTTYMWGDAFLVSPVVAPGLKSQKVYLPKGHLWFDYYSGKTAQGGQELEVDLVKEHIPVFVKSGSFIPTLPGLMSSADYSLENFDVDFYFGKDLESHYQLYNDDGLGALNLDTNSFELIDFESSYVDNKTLTLKIKNTVGQGFEANDKTINLNIHGIESEPKRVKIDKKKTTFLYDAQKQMVILQIELDKNENTTIIIK